MAGSSTLTRPTGSSSATSFEFTKRKRWADLLITELADAITLVLSPACDVLYCGPAVTELLGWKDVDLVDSDFLEFIGDEDKASFRAGFYEAIRTSSNFLSYARIKCQNGSSSYPLSPAKEIFFEITGRPYFLPTEGELQCKCFFAMAKPYPSRNTTTLHTFLDLKLENERLEQRLQDLKANPVISKSSPYASGGPVYPSATLQSRLNAVSSQPYYPSSSTGGRYDAMLPSMAYGSGSSSLYGATTVPSSVPATPTDEDVADDGHRKKKMKRGHPDQYVCVTCGRTDSPEWRKGPLGPKTLCNACGLRWAKQMRKTDDSATLDPNEGPPVTMISQ